MSNDDLRGDSALEEEDVLLDEDDFLVQRYLDGDLQEDEQAAFERRVDAEPELADRLDKAEALFRALDSSALARSALMWSREVPKEMVEEAISRWQAESLDSEVAERRPVFGGRLHTVSFFAVANAVLLTLLVGVAALRGPQEVLHAWVVSAKDLALFVVANTPSAEQITLGLPALLLGSIAGLSLVSSVMRRMLRRERTDP